eukprot:359619-Chlamydomonas_euryale.AAC.10
MPPSRALAPSRRGSSTAACCASCQMNSLAAMTFERCGQELGAEWLIAEPEEEKFRVWPTLGFVKPSLAACMWTRICSCANLHKAGHCLYVDMHLQLRRPAQGWPLLAAFRPSSMGTQDEHSFLVAWTSTGARLNRSPFPFQH